KGWGRRSCSWQRSPQNSSEITGDPQALESVFGLVVQRAAGALRHLGGVELGEDFVDVGSRRGDGIGDVLIAEGAIALAVFGDVERDDRNVLAPGVGPDVGLGPMQDRVDAQMSALRRRGVELVPEFRRL